VYICHISVKDDFSFPINVFMTDPLNIIFDNLGIMIIRI